MSAAATFATMRLTFMLKSAQRTTRWRRPERRSGLLARVDLLRPDIRRHGRRGARAEVVEHEQPDRGGQIALLTVVVDLADQLRQRHVPQSGNLLHAVPEGLFEADAGLVSSHHDRTLNDGRLHDASP